MKARGYKGVGINGRFLTRDATGVDRYAREMTLALDKLLAPGDACVIVPGGAEVRDPLALENISVIGHGSSSGYVWEQLELPGYLADNGLLGLNLCNTAPFARPGIVCIHDMNARANPGFFSRRFAAAYRLMFSVLCRRAQAVVTVSEFSRSEIEKYYPATTGKCFVVPCAWQHIERTEPDWGILDRLGLSRGGFFFALSSLAPNKNLEWIARSAELNPQETVVVAGGLNARVHGRRGVPGEGRVVYAGYTTDAESKALLASCKGFLFPSFYEGFGIPPMEALACGAKVIASDIPAIREVYGGSVRYIDPWAPTCDLAGLTAEETEPADTVLRKFNWDNSAKLLLDVVAMRFGATSVSSGDGALRLRGRRPLVG